MAEKTCDSIWTFERVIGYTLDEPANKEFKSIILKSSCQDLCLAEKSFPCRSITYDYGRRICRLFSETRRSKPGSFKLTSDYIDYFDNKCAKGLLNKLFVCTLCFIKSVHLQNCPLVNIEIFPNVTSTM